MKKINVTILAMLMAFAVSAQDLTSKKGEPILPEADDWALGFNAVPFLNYAGNFLNQAGNSSPAPAYINGFGNTIVGKMFIDNATAYRAMVRLNFTSVSMTNMVADDASANPGDMVEDKQSTSSSNVTLGLGQEWRRGKTRVQGYYGAMGMLTFGSTSTTTEYGNDFSATNQTPTSTTSFFNGASGPVNSRTTEASSGATFGLMVRGFAGVEIFVFPKVSVGFEYGWGLGFGTTGGGTTTTEAADGTASTNSDSESGKTSVFGFDVDNGQGAMNIIFHF